MAKKQKSIKKRKWGLKGYDTFEGEYYALSGKFDTEKQTRKAARVRFEELEISQPSSSSGGQGFSGIQDQVFIVRPDGSMYRFIG